jgi:mycoredoxin-dependent peroxiredoxin
VSGLRNGSPAPGFELRDQHGQEVRLSAFAGRPVLLVFYPFAFSRVCTGELAAVRDSLDRLRDTGAEVLGVSCDPMFTLRAYAEEQRLTFPLLSDFWPHGATSTAYDVFDDERGCSRRSTYILDGAGTVRWSVHHPMPEARDLQEYVRVLEGLRAEK